MYLACLGKKLVELLGCDVRDGARPSTHRAKCASTSGDGEACIVARSRHVLDMQETRVGRVVVLGMFSMCISSPTCVCHALDMRSTCVGHALDMCWTDTRHVFDFRLMCSIYVGRAFDMRLVWFHMRLVWTRHVLHIC